MPSQSSFDAMISRRRMLAQSGLGFGTLALAHLLDETQELVASEPAAQSAGRADLTPRPPHGHARAKAVIMLMQSGGPSQMDLFDPKPDLNARARSGLSRQSRNVSAGQ